MQADDLYKVIRIFIDDKPIFSIDDAVHDFDGRPGKGLYAPKVQWDRIAEHYRLPEITGDWDFQKDTKERVVNLTNPEAIEHTEHDKPLNLQGNWVTYYDILAARSKVIGGNAFRSIAAGAVLKTHDNQILIGVRGGEATPERKEKIGVGLYGTAPGGVVTFKTRYDEDPISDLVRQEFREEIGNFNSYSHRLIGIFEAYRPGPTGIKFVSTLSTDATLGQIQRTNKNANELYWGMIGRGASRAEAGYELRKKGLPPDAWEHFPFIGIPNDRESIQKLVYAQPQSFAGIGAGWLMTLTAYLKKTNQESI